MEVWLLKLEPFGFHREELGCYSQSHLHFAQEEFKEIQLLTPSNGLARILYQAHFFCVSVILILNAGYCYYSVSQKIMIPLGQCKDELFTWEESLPRESVQEMGGRELREVR